MEDRQLCKINNMPTKELLEEFLKGMHSRPTVWFNTKAGQFEYIERCHATKLERDERLPPDFEEASYRQDKEVSTLRR